ncbi:odorant binding protein 7 [Temnothorax americanus]|uniref:odorant binding protein 7 n=1 Tax=Temnothorax americanus TaxID=1964332 RepID=UPI004067EB96
MSMEIQCRPVVGSVYASCSFLLLKRRKMKKVGLFVLALIAIVIADDKRLEEVAKRFETDGETIQACLQEVEADSEEISTLIEKWDEAQDDAISDDAKQSLMKYSNFLGCILQKKGMIKEDGTLVVDKLIESVENDNDLPKPSNKEGLTKCLNLLNEDNKMTRDDKVFGLMLCVINNQMDEEGGSK